MWFSSTVFRIFLMYKVVFIPLVIELLIFDENVDGIDLYINKMSK